VQYSCHMEPQYIGVCRGIYTIASGLMFGMFNAIAGSVPENYVVIQYTKSIHRINTQLLSPLESIG
jgi:hypothetical protein